ncbi:hypothetical protein [Actinoplanes sp. NPDC089786]|uniref:hypothetical protein n=1 Tax=Actinoplanes sp. NPDC089786 TaxID=3155185 RepID=UPI0034270E11
MTNTDLHEAMRDIAQRAPVPPADLLERVEAGHRRQRRTQTITAAFAAVLVLAVGGWVVLRPPVERALPTTDFLLPALPARPPLITETWPGATVTGNPPDPAPGRAATVVGRIDQGHLLVFGRPLPGTDDASTAFWSYAVADRTYRLLVDSLRGRASVTAASISSTTIAWVQREKDNAELMTSPVAGGLFQQLAGDTTGPPGITGVYATADAVYMSDQDFVIRFTGATSSSSTILRVYDRMQIDGTVWAHSADRTRFRNLVTGEERQVIRPAGADKLDCVAAYCLGHDPAGWFLQRPDGSARTTLPYPGAPRLVGDLLLLRPGTLLDPLRGKLGVASRDPLCGETPTRLAGELHYGWREKTGAGCNGAAHHAYLRDTD